MVIIMEIVNINALWSQNYFNHKTLMQKLKNQYNEIKYIDYDYDFKREQIKFFNKYQLFITILYRNL